MKISFEFAAKIQMNGANFSKIFVLVTQVILVLNAINEYIIWIMLILHKKKLKEKWFIVKTHKIKITLYKIHHKLHKTVETWK